MVDPYGTNFLVLPFLFSYIAFSHQAPLYKDDKSKDKLVNRLSVSKSFAPPVLALVLSVSLSVLGWAIPDDSGGTVGSALPALGKACQRIIT